ncbi:MAG: RQC domain-containing protein, partial [Alphaproteobacteria bacterium]|nr:RQC domain-containing protein [Alphaproteobacteria bacterium]
GQPAEAHMLYGLGDIRMRRLFIEQEAAGEERKRREHRRLDALLGFCESSTCRRCILLDYFGEATAACGNCDACLEPVEMVDGTGEGQKILSAVHQTGQRFGAVHIIDVLRGQMTEKVTAAGHDRLASFGVGAEHKKEQWRSMIRQLVSAGFLHLDVQGYGGLTITEKGQGLLRGDEAFQYRQDTLRRAAPPGRQRRKAALIAELSTAETTILETLKALRLRLAKERGVPAYVVFSDKSLADMAQRQPRNTAEFAEVNGVGAAKLKEFAVPFLEAIAAASAAAPVPMSGD